MRGELPEGPVTILFTDVEGSTALRTRLGDGPAHRLLRQAEDIVRGQLEAHDGVEVKGTGDGHMVWFASPRKAVACAVAIQRALEGHAVRIRMGLNTGEVTPDGGDLYGEAVNAAARVAAKAAGGEILVAEVVRQLTGTLVDARYVERGRFRLKGFPDRWRLFAVEWNRTGPAAGVEQPLVGRGAELAALCAVTDAATAGRGRVGIVEGEAGIGKSRLVAEAIAAARRSGVSIFHGKADDLGRDRPLGALVDALDLVPHSADARRRELARLLVEDPSGSGNVVFRAVDESVALIEDVAVDGPVVVVLEDLHWADPLTLLALRSLTRRVSTLPISVVTTLRPTPRSAELDGVLVETVDAGATRLLLGPLEDEDALTVAAAVAGAQPGPALRRQIAGTAGNPLFVIELVRALATEGRLVVGDGIVDVGDSAVPSSLRTTLARRLGYLRSDTLDTLRMASVLGSTFTLTDLAAVLDRPAISVLGALQPALQAGVVTERPTGLAFRHDLIREALYEDLSPTVRTGLHDAAGRALAAAGADALLVATHLSRSARRGDREAMSWLARAGRQAARSDLGTGVRLLEQALEVSAPRDPEAVEILSDLVALLAWSGRTADAQSRAEQALSAGLTAEEEVLIRRTLAEVLLIIGDSPGALLHAEAALDLEPDDGPRAELLSVAALAGETDKRGRAEAAVAAAEAANNDIAIATGLLALGQWNERYGLIRRYVDLTSRAVAVIRRAAGAGEGRSGLYLAWALSVHGNALVQSGELDRAERVLQDARRQIEQVGALAMLVTCHTALADALFMAGRWADASVEAEAAETLRAEIGLALDTALSYEQAWREAAYGDPRRATALLDEIDRQRGETFAGWRIRALLLHLEGRTTEALAILENSWKAHRAFPDLIWQYREWSALLVTLAIKEGHPGLAEEVTTHVEATVRERGAGIAGIEASARLCRAVTDADPDAVLRVVDEYRLLPGLPERAGNLEIAAEALSHLGRSGDAVRLLEEALGVYEVLGAEHPAARVQHRLRRMGAVRRRRTRPMPSTFGWESLTSSELEVVDLVADGLSNPRVAERLHLSRHTVETHLRHIYAKLAISTRVELTAEAVRRRQRTAP